MSVSSEDTSIYVTGKVSKVTGKGTRMVNWKYYIIPVSYTHLDVYKRQV